MFDTPFIGLDFTQFLAHMFYTGGFIAGGMCLAQS